MNIFKLQDKLQIAYNLELIQSYFKPLYGPYTATSSSCGDKLAQNLQQFLLQESKKYFNFHKLKGLIEQATNQSVEVQFKKVKIHLNNAFINMIDYQSHFIAE